MRPAKCYEELKNILERTVFKVLPPTSPSGQFTFIQLKAKSEQSFASKTAPPTLYTMATRQHFLTSYFSRNL